mgnify:CR=1 FL=1
MGAVAFAASSVSGDKVEYDFKSGQAVAEGNVEIRHDKGRATARKAEYNTKTGEGSLKVRRCRSRRRPSDECVPHHQE